MFSSAALIPKDAIFGLAQKAKNDPKSLNLVVGAYRDENGKPMVLPVIRKVEKMLANDDSLNKEYLPISGLQTFRDGSAKLLLGGDNPVLGKVASIQGLSGTGSLRIAGEFLHRVYPKSSVYVSTPTWGNHGNIFKEAGFSIEKYPYWDAEKLDIDQAGFLSTLRTSPENSIVVLHSCAHNPTGMDVPESFWAELADVVVARKLIPIFDTAYQGFATGDIDRDAKGVRLFASRGISFLFAQSFSKNAGLYCERVGLCGVVCSSETEAQAVQSQLNALARAMYSNPPAHGARIMAMIFNDPALFNQWRTELRGMADRILSMREMLYNRLVENKTPGNWDHVMKQGGMFSFTGLSAHNVERLQKEHHVYMLSSGRVNIAGLTKDTVNVFADAVHSVLTTPEPASL